MFDRVCIHTRFFGLPKMTTPGGWSILELSGLVVSSHPFESRWIQYNSPEPHSYVWCWWKRESKRFCALVLGHTLIMKVWADRKGRGCLGDSTFWILVR